MKKHLLFFGILILFPLTVVCAASGSMPGGHCVRRSDSSGGTEAQSLSAFLMPAKPTTSEHLNERSEPIDQLRTLFGNLLDTYSIHGTRSDPVMRFDLLHRIRALMPSCVESNKIGTVTVFKRQIKFRVSFLMHASAENANYNLLELLRMLPDKELDSIVSQEILPNESALKMIIKHFCQNPESVNAFKGTILQPQALLNCSIDGTSVQDTLPVALESFLEVCDDDALVRYESIILPHIPMLIRIKPNQIVPLRLKASPAISAAALESSIAYCGTEPALCNVFMGIIFGFIEALESAEAKNDVFGRMHAAFMANNNMYALQYMWLKLSKNGQNKMLRRSIKQCFNVHALPAEAKSMSFPAFLNTVMKEAYEKQTVALQTIHAALLSADQIRIDEESFFDHTKLGEFIDQTLHSAVYDQVIFDDQTPFVQRIEHLNGRLRVTKDAMPFLSSVGHAARDIDFKEYVDALVAMHTAQSASSSSSFASSTYTMCAAKKAILNLLQKYNQRRRLPLYVDDIFGDLPNFSQLPHCENHQTEITLSRLSNICIEPNELIYGTSTNGRTLIAADPETLYAVWYIPFSTSSQTIPMAVFGQYLFALDSVTSSFYCFDKHTGHEQQRYSLPVQCGTPPYFFAPDAEGNFYIMYKDNEGRHRSVFFDNRTGECLTFGGDYSYRPFIHAAGLGYTNQKEKAIVLFSKNELIGKIPCSSDGRLISRHDPKVAVHKNLVFFQRKNPDNSYAFIAYNTTEHKEQYIISLQNELDTPPCISQDGKHIFLACAMNGESSIISLTYTEEGYHEVWRTEKIKKIDSLILSPDAQQLFAMSSPIGKLHTLDVASGHRKMTDFKTACRLKGVSPSGRPYICRPNIS